MSELNFPKYPAVGQEYVFNNLVYTYDGTKWTTKSAGYNPVSDLYDLLSSDAGAAFVGATGYDNVQAAIDDLADFNQGIQSQLDAKADKAVLAAPDGATQVGFIQTGTNAIARTVQDKHRESISVHDFMLPDMIADTQLLVPTMDHTAALQNAINETIKRNTTLDFPAGSYNYTTLAASASATARHITIRALGRVVLTSTKTSPDTTNYDADYAIRFRGYYVEEVLLTEDADINDGLLHLSSVTNISPGDLLEVKCSRLIQTDHRGNAREGQLVRVNSVNSAGLHVGLDAPLELYAPANRITAGSITAVTSTTEFTLGGIDLPAREVMVSFTFTSGVLNGQTRYVTSWDNVTKIAKFEEDQASWPTGAAVGDTFNLVWATKVSVMKPINPSILGDFHFERVSHSGAIAGDYGFRGIDIVAADCPRVEGITVRRFSETGIRFRGCFRPVMKDSIVTDANRCYDGWNGTGYGVSVMQSFEGFLDNVTTYRCRKGIDIGGAQYLSWRTRVVNCNASGGGVTYDDQSFWPIGPGQNCGMGSHGSSYAAIYSNCQVADQYTGYSLHGLEESIQDCHHRGYGETCVRFYHGGALSIDGFTYNDRFSEIGKDAATRYNISSTPLKRCWRFIEIYVDSDTYIQSLPIVIKNVTARKLGLAFISIKGDNIDGKLSNVVIGNNVVWASPEGGTNTEFSFLRAGSEKQLVNLQDLGGNRYTFDGEDYLTFFYYGIGLNHKVAPGTYLRIKDDTWTATIADDTVVKIPMDRYTSTALVTIWDRERDRNYRAFDMLLYVDRAGDYSPLSATNKLGVELSSADLTGTTGTDGQVTISYRPSTAGDGSYMYIENRAGIELRPIITIKTLM